MTEDPIVLRSALPYQIIIFIILQIWALMCYEISQYQMVILYDTPFSWIGWATFLLVLLIPVLGITVWKLKDQVQLSESHWNFCTREVDLDEYEQMIKDYNRKYSFVMSSFSHSFIITTILLFLGILLVPFFLMQTNSLVISLTPVILALLVMFFGFAFGLALFKAMPNSATNEFPYHRPRRYRKKVRFLLSLPGVFWSGIRMIIGEDRGFYTIRNPLSIARIEGLEGVAWIEWNENSTGTTSTICSLLQINSSEEPLVVGELIMPTTKFSIVELIKKTMLLYIEHKGTEELLDDILEDIDNYLAEQMTIYDEK